MRPTYTFPDSPRMHENMLPSCSDLQHGCIMQRTLQRRKPFFMLFRCSTWRSREESCCNQVIERRSQTSIWLYISADAGAHTSLERLDDILIHLQMNRGSTASIEMSK